MLENTTLQSEFSLKRIKLKVAAYTYSFSAKSLAECFFLRAPLSVLALTYGLGELSHLLGCARWVCLTAAGVGLMIFVGLAAAFVVFMKYPEREEPAGGVTQDTLHRAAVDMLLGRLASTVRELEPTSTNGVSAMSGGGASTSTPDLGGHTAATPTMTVTE
jgi:hypothetical protein